MNFYDVINKRRTIRAFTNQDVSPEVMEKNTMGTTIILIIFKKIVPIGFKIVAFSPKIRPIIIPKPKPIKCFHIY